MLFGLLLFACLDRALESSFVGSREGAADGDTNVHRSNVGRAEFQIWYCPSASSITYSLLFVDVDASTTSKRVKTRNNLLVPFVVTLLAS